MTKPSNILPAAAILTLLFTSGHLTLRNAKAQQQSKVKEADSTVQKEGETREQIDALIKQLGDKAFKVRKAAQKKLIAIGSPALDALDKAAKSSENTEVQARAESIAKEIRDKLAIASAKEEYNRMIKAFQLTAEKGTTQKKLFGQLVSGLTRLCKEKKTDKLKGFYFKYYISGGHSLEIRWKQIGHQSTSPEGVTDVSVGPGPDGLTMLLRLRDKKDSRERPQSITGPDGAWITYLGQIYLPEIKAYLLLNLSFGSDIDKELLRAFTNPKTWLMQEPQQKKWLK